MQPTVTQTPVVQQQPVQALHQPAQIIHIPATPGPSVPVNVQSPQGNVRYIKLPPGVIKGIYNLTVNSLIYCSNVQFLYSLKSVPLLFHCFRNYLQSDRHTHRRTDVLEIILIRNLLMVNHTVVIASVTACLT